jgi:hypothetical protein
MMKLISTDVSPDDFFLEPIQYVFQDGDSESVVSFIPTVPHGAEAEVLYGDLFACRVRDISYESVPVPVGSDEELAIIETLQGFVAAHKAREQQDILRCGKFPKMDGEMVGWQSMLWFISALKARRERARTTSPSR